MTAVSLLTDGDELEKGAYQSLQPFADCYERFWLLHVHPLRCQGSILLRRRIDEQFETMAINHYTTFQQLARAHEKITNRIEDFKFVEEIYANLDRAAEVATDLARAFVKIYTKCLKRAPKVTTESLSKIRANLRKYRNVLHDPVLATVKEGDIRLLPRGDQIKKYRRWTAAMYERDRSDFVPAETQLWSDFGKLCSALQDTWKDMLIASEALVTNPLYLELRGRGDHPSQVSTSAPAISGTMVPGASPTIFGVQGPAPPKRG